MHFYTGIGSRDLPDSVAVVIDRVAVDLRQRGYILRSGHAPGSDQCFEYAAASKAHLYLPWPGFEREVPFNGCPTITVPSGKLFLEAQDLAAEIHPNWNGCSRPAQLLLTRNVFQVLGNDLDTPSDLLICYAIPDKRSVKGGTKIAYEVAKKFNIPTYNLYFPNEEEDLMEFLELEYVA